jgi:hypothetical protein
MLSKLAKIANRLDSLGLTREADVLDSFIRKVAEDAAEAGMNAPPATKDGTTTWEDNGYTYSYNPNTTEMFIVSGPKITAPIKITQTSNSTAYYTILNQYEAKMGLRKTVPVLPVDANDENAVRVAITPLYNSIKEKFKGEWVNQAGKKYANNPGDAKTTISVKFNILKNGTIDPKTCVVTSSSPDFAWFADICKKILLPLKGPTLTDVVPINISFGFNL